MQFQGRDELGLQRRADIAAKRVDPDPTKISTSYVERQNLAMRMSMRRMTRLTNAFSKKAENLGHSVSLHYIALDRARNVVTRRVG